MTKINEEKFNAEEFCKLYIDCWSNATSEIVRFRNRSFPELYMGSNCQSVDVDSDEKRDKAGIKAWTDFHMEKILYPLISQLNYKSTPCENCTSHKDNADYRCKSSQCGYGSTWQREYYKVDLSLYTYGEKWKWRADYFIEHENETFVLANTGEIVRKGWLGEFNKLCPLKCSKNGARVIISYADLSSTNIANIIKYLRVNLDNETTKESLTESPILIILAPTVNYIKRALKENFDVLLTFILFEFKNGTWICTTNRADEIHDNTVHVESGINVCQNDIITRFNFLKNNLR